MLYLYIHFLICNENQVLFQTGNAKIHKKSLNFAPFTRVVQFKLPLVIGLEFLDILFILPAPCCIRSPSYANRYLKPIVVISIKKTFDRLRCPRGFGPPRIWSGGGDQIRMGTKSAVTTVRCFVNKCITPFSGPEYTN